MFVLVNGPVLILKIIWFKLISFKCVLELTESECRSMHLGNKLKTFYITDDGNTMNFHVFEMRIGMAYSRPT